MSILVEPFPASATPRDLIGRVRDARVRREAAERDVLALAGEWAAGHEVEGPSRFERSGVVRGFGDGVEDDVSDGADDGREADLLDRAFARYDAACRGEQPACESSGGDPGPVFTAVSARADVEEVEEAERRRGWRGLPELTWDCAGPFGTALGQTTQAAWHLLRQALILTHRLPRTHRAWQAGQLDTRPAKLIADAVAGQADDVCAWVDAKLARRLELGQNIGPVVAERLVNEAMAELHAEELELLREEKLRARYARIGLGPNGRPGPDPLGLAEFVIRGDWPDITAFNDTIAALAEALRLGDGPDAAEPLDVRRSLAVGILADPARALALLGHTPDEPVAEDEVAQPPSRSPRKSTILLTLHLAADATAGTDTYGNTWLTSIIGEWAGRTDTSVTIRPVIHCGGCADCDTYCDDRHLREGYVPTDLDRERVALLNPHCVFPYCHKPTDSTDCDHIVPFDPDNPSRGPTCPKCNLAPLCRHHHRLKTHAGWTYRQLEPGTHTWTEPHGQRFLVTRHGTRDLTGNLVGD